MTTALPAIVWLQFFWAVEQDMSLGRCPCGRVFVAPNRGYRFCWEHAAPFWATPAERNAFDQARGRAIEPERWLPSWVPWRQEYRGRGAR